MKKILGLLLLLVISVTLLSVAAIPAIFWLDNWLQVLGAVTCFLVIVFVEVVLLLKYITNILDALIKKGNDEPSK